jgi:hypothetical protein
MRVEAFSEPVILSGDIKKLPTIPFVPETHGVDMKPRCFLSEEEVLSLW